MTAGRGPLLSALLVTLQGVVLAGSALWLLATGERTGYVALLLAVGVALVWAAFRLRRGSPGARASVIFYEVAVLALSVASLLIGHQVLLWGLAISVVVLTQLLRRPAGEV